MDVCPQIAKSKGAAVPPPPASRMLLYMNVPGQLMCMVNDTVNGHLSSDSRIEGSCVRLFNKAGFITVQQQAVKPCCISLIDLCYKSGFFSNLFNYE